MRQHGWTRQSARRVSLVPVDISIGETSERYRVTLTGITSIEIEVAEPFSDVAADVVSTLGASSIVIEVRQIGDFAVSRPAQITL